MKPLNKKDKKEIETEATHKTQAVVRYFESEHPILIQRAYVPKAEIKTMYSNQAVFWVDWSYGCLEFPRWTIWRKQNGKLGIIKYSRGKSQYSKFPLVKAPFEFWNAFAVKLAEVNPIGLSKLEFMQQVDLPGFHENVVVKSGEELIPLIKQEQEDLKENKYRVF